MRVPHSLRQNPQAKRRHFLRARLEKLEDRRLLSASELGYEDNVVDSANSVTAAQHESRIIGAKDRPTVEIVADQPTIGEGDETGSFTIMLSQASTEDVSMSLLRSGTATIGTDYVSSPVDIVIPAGETSATFSVTSIDDNVDEIDETVTIEIAAFVNATPGIDTAAAIQIIDDDPIPELTLSFDELEIRETGGMSVGTFQLNAPSGSDVLIDLAVAGTASTNDYVLSDGPLLIPAGQTFARINVTTVHDIIYETDETITFEITSIVGATPVDPQVLTLTIGDDDPTPQLSLTVDTPLIAEDGGTAVVTAQIGTPSALDITIDLAPGGTAGDADFTFGPAQLVIPAGTTVATATITSIADDIHEGSETASLSITNITNALPPSVTTVQTTIVNDDPAPTFTLAADKTSIPEKDGTFTVTAHLSNESGRDVTIEILGQGAAEADADYVTTGVITIPAGETSGSVVIDSVEDSIYETDEAIVVGVRSSLNATEAGDQSLTTVIIDNDIPPVVGLSFAVDSQSEGTRTALLSANLDVISEIDVAVDIDFTGTANSDDFDSETSQILIPAGTLSGYLTLQIADDRIDELNEKITATIVSASDASIDVTRNTSTLTIIDDDAAPTASLALSTSIASESGSPAFARVSLSEASSLDVTIDFAISGSATADVDYSAPALQTTIPAGSLSGEITVNMIEDFIDEVNETVTLSFASLQNADAIGNPQATLTIIDNDNPPALSLDVDRQSITEGADSAIVTLSLSEATTFNVLVGISYSGSATSGLDYQGNPNFINIPAGESSLSIPLTAFADSLNEGNETIRVEVTSITHATPTGTLETSVTIVDDNPVPIVSLAINDTTLNEAGGTALLTASIPAPSGLDTVITLAPGGDADENDYRLSSDSITIPAGSTWGQIEISVIDDSLNEVAETIEIGIASILNGSPTAQPLVSTTIIDNDAQPTVTLSSSATTIIESAGQTSITATLSEISGRDVLVDLEFSGEAQINADYTVPGSQIVIPAGSRRGSITVTAIDDLIDESPESIVTQVIATAGATLPSPQTNTSFISDDDTIPRVTLSSEVAQIEESESAVLLATLDTPSSFDITLSLGFTGNATGNGVDYQASSLQMIIPAGQLSATATVDAVDDFLDEPDESFSVEIRSSGSRASFLLEDIVIGILDNDDAPTVSFELESTNVAEGADVDYTATLSAPTSFDVTLAPIFSGTAGANSDYSLSAASITIPAGETVGTITIHTIDDTAFEPVESLVIEPAAVENAQFASAGGLQLDITDNDDAPIVNLSARALNVNEDTSASVNVTLSEISGRDTIVGLSFAGTAALGDDYVQPATTITIPAGQALATVPIDVIDDHTDEALETITVSITSIENADVGPSSQLTFNVNDNDPATEAFATISSTELSESGGRAELTLTLERPSGIDVTFDVAATGNAILGTDYTLGSQLLTIPAGEMTATTEIIAIDNAILNSPKSIFLFVTSGDNAADFDGAAFDLTIRDDGDKGSFSVTTAQTPIMIDEASTSANISVVLTSPPAGDVVLIATSSDDTEAHVSPRTLTFTTLDWDSPQQFTVTGLGDLEDDDDVMLSVTVSVDEPASSAGFAGLDPVVVEFVNKDVPVTNFSIREESGRITVRNADNGAIVASGLPLGSIDFDLTGKSQTIDVGALGNFGGTISIKHQSDDAVSYGDGAKADRPQFVEGQFTHVIRSGDATILVKNDNPHVHPFRPLDANRDGKVTALDALIGINQLNASGAGPLGTPVEGSEPIFYLDVNGDAQLTAIDSLRIINYLNAEQLVTGSAEAPLQVAPLIETTVTGREDSSVLPAIVEQTPGQSTLRQALVSPQVWIGQTGGALNDPFKEEEDVEAEAEATDLAIEDMFSAQPR